MRAPPTRYKCEDCDAEEGYYPCDELYYFNLVTPARWLCETCVAETDEWFQREPEHADASPADLLKSYSEPGDYSCEPDELYQCEGKDEAGDDCIWCLPATDIFWHTPKRQWLCVECATDYGTPYSKHQQTNQEKPPQSQ